MDEVVIASVEDLKKLLETMPENVVISLSVGKGEDENGQEECI